MQTLPQPMQRSKTDSVGRSALQLAACPAAECCRRRQLFAQPEKGRACKPCTCCFIKSKQQVVRGYNRSYGLQPLEGEGPCRGTHSARRVAREGSATTLAGVQEAQPLVTSEPKRPHSKFSSSTRPRAGEVLHETCTEEVFARTVSNAHVYKKNNTRKEKDNTRRKTSCMLFCWGG